MSSKDQSLIAGVMESFVSEVPVNPFVSFCVDCNKGVIKEEMAYQKGKVFHKDCYAKNGSKYPEVNQEQLSQTTNDIVQLIQLRNLKIRTMDGSNTKRKKTKKKSKSKTKKRQSKRRTGKRTTIKRKKTRKKSSRKRPSKKRPTAKRRTSPKRKKTNRKTKRRVSRNTKRKTRRRR